MSDLSGKKRIAVLTVALVLCAAAAAAGIHAWLHRLRPVSGITSVRAVAVGDRLTFGVYEQDGQAANGAEPIEWRVLDKKDGMVLLLAEKLLDYQRYNDRYIPMTWEDCTLRAWMNGTFFQTAFSEAERERIALTAVDNPPSVLYGTNGGHPTEDRIFALSYEEARRYFASDRDRKAVTTEAAHAKANGVDNFGHTGFWWLRSPGNLDRRAACVNGYGYVVPLGSQVSDKAVAVRPALWLRL